MAKRKPIPKGQRRNIMIRDRFTCQICGFDLSESPKYRRVIDHKIPLSKGGTNKSSNLWLLCDRCDKVKGDNMVDDIVQDYIVNRLKEIKFQRKIKINNLKPTT